MRSFDVINHPKEDKICIFFKNYLGVSGEHGEKGERGLQGTDGAAGRPGEQGNLNIIKLLKTDSFSHGKTGIFL